MFRSTIILALGLAAATADEATVPPVNIRLLVQLVEVPHPDLTKLLAGVDTSGPALHAAAIALTASGRAKVLDSAVITTRNGQAATIESIQEVIYPTEFDPPQLPCGGQPTRAEKAARDAELGFFRWSPAAWDTRNAGLTLEVCPTASPDGRSVELALIPEWVEYAGDRTVFEWRGTSGRLDIKIPDFRTLRTNLNLTVVPGSFGLGAVLSPVVDAPAPILATKVMVFIRADLPSH